MVSREAKGDMSFAHISVVFEAVIKFNGFFAEVHLLFFLLCCSHDIDMIITGGSL